MEIDLRKGKVPRKHRVHGENSSLGLVEDIHQLKYKIPLH